jgi:hypothetical protein
MNTPLSAKRILTALMISCCVAGLAPAAAIAAPAPVASHHKHKVKLDAQLEKTRVNKGESTKIKGNLSELSGMESVTGDEPLVVQRLDLATKTWVDVTSTSCRPNGRYSVSVSFSFSANLSLRIYHPETDLYASAYSSVFALLVL